MLRSLLERYLLFRHLSDANELDVFDDWCYKERFEHLNRIKGVPEFKGRPEFKSWVPTESQKVRFQAIKDDPRVSAWKRPDIGEICKRLEMKFLYHACYDWGSGHVHPTTQLGDADFRTLMGRDSGHDPNEDKIILNNSILVMALHMQHFMNQPEYNWQKALYDLIDAFPRVANDELSSYEELFDSVTTLYDSKVSLLAPSHG